MMLVEPTQKFLISATLLYSPQWKQPVYHSIKYFMCCLHSKHVLTMCAPATKQAQEAKALPIRINILWPTLFGQQQVCRVYTRQTCYWQKKSYLTTAISHSVYIWMFHENVCQSYPSCHNYLLISVFLMLKQFLLHIHMLFSEAGNRSLRSRRHKHFHNSYE